jgi:hypothetical protein
MCGIQENTKFSFYIILIGYNFRLKTNNQMVKLFDHVERNGYKTKIMYFYYIVVKIYVFVCTNIHSPIYFLCMTIMPHHFHTMHFTHSQIMPKTLKNKLSTPFISLIHETFHSFNKLFSSSDGVFKCPKNTHFLITR